MNSTQQGEGMMGSKSEIDWTKATDENVAMAAFPDLQLVDKASRELSAAAGPNGLRQTMYYATIHIPNKPFRTELAIGWGTSRALAIDDAFRIARQHPLVQAFERAHKPESRGEQMAEEACDMRAQEIISNANAEKAVVDAWPAQKRADAEAIWNPKLPPVEPQPEPLWEQAKREVIAKHPDACCADNGAGQWFVYVSDDLGSEILRLASWCDSEQEAWLSAAEPEPSVDASPEPKCVCLAECGNYRCTLQKGHGGPHRAQGLSKTIKCWVQSASPVAVEGEAKHETATGMMAAFGNSFYRVKALQAEAWHMGFDAGVKAAFEGLEKAKKNPPSPFVMP